MKIRTVKHLSTMFLLCCFCSVLGQNVSLYQQYNGRYDFVFIGNTLNTIENNSVFGMPDPPCTILTSSSANLNLNSNDIIQNAYLYWAGSGTGDLTVTLNNQEITAQRTFSIINSAGLPCFSAFADVTSLVQITGNGTYLLSNFDLTNIIAPYCDFGGNFGGWAIIIVYENANLPLNQLNIYDGMQAVPNAINITLNSLNVIDNAGAKIGFVAWEGDKNIANNESLSINGNLIGNPPLNPTNNAFNGTNSFTGDDNLFNMDLDVYSIQNNIHVGDTTAQIQLTSSQDFVMINAIVTKLNSQLPDATILINSTNLQCNSRQVLINYTAQNLVATNLLPSATPIAIYANGILIANTTTTADIPIGGSQNGQITVTIPASFSDNFVLNFVIDDNGTGHGTIPEILENNNNFQTNISLLTAPKFNVLDPIFSCNKGFGSSYFDFSNYSNLIKTNPTDTVLFFENANDANANLNPIVTTNNYFSNQTPKEIFARIQNQSCYSIASFSLKSRNCLPIVYNVLTPNNDGANDLFFIDGLRNIFLNYQLSIYNRWGTLVWVGNNNLPDWDGFCNQKNIITNNEMPTGTYFYVLELNDSDFPNPLNGYLYLTR